MRVLVLAITLLLAAALPGWAADMLILQSSRDNAYSQAVSGFSTYYPGDARVVILSDYAEVDVVRLVKEEHAQTILAVGENALTACRKVREVPVVALLAPSVNHYKLPGNVYGINILADPSKYIGLCQSMGKHRIGLLYDSKKSGRYVHQATQAAREAGVSIETLEVHDGHEVQAALGKLRGKVDALWVLPDSTVVSAVNMEAYILFSINNKVPIISYLKQHLRNGAAASLDVDFFDLGRQAGEICKQLERKGARGAPSVVAARKVLLNTNEGVMHKLGIAMAGQ